MAKVNHVDRRSFDRNLAHIVPCNPTGFDLSHADNAFCSLYLPELTGFNGIEKWSTKRTSTMKVPKVSNPQVGEVNSVMMSDLKTLKRILAYVAENKLKAALEVEFKYMVVEAKKIQMHLDGPGKDFNPEPSDKVPNKVQGQRLDAIYDDEPLDFEKYPLESNTNMLA